MKTFLLGLIIIVGITSINSCEKDSVNNQQEQKIYFEFYAINYAWGLYYVHWVIDDQGNVRENKKQDSLIWINSDNLNEYVEMFDTVIYTVEKSELDYYIDLIPSAANGEIFEKEHNRADSGKGAFNCYMQENDSHKVVILSEMSDVIDKTNLDSNAVKIDKWLKDLHRLIYSNE